VEVAGAVTATQLSPAQWTESFLPDTTLTFRYEVEGKPFFATTLFPKTYEDAKMAAIALFNLDKGDAVSLELWIPNERGYCLDTKIIHPSQWPLIILRTAQKNPQFEVSVKPFRRKSEWPGLCTILGYSLLAYIVAAVLSTGAMPSPKPDPPKSFWGL